MKPSKVVKTPEGNIEAAVKQVVKSVVKPVNVPVVQPSQDNEAVVKPVPKTVVKSVTGGVKRKITYIANGTLAKRTRNSTLANKLKE